MFNRISSGRVAVCLAFLSGCLFGFGDNASGYMKWVIGVTATIFVILSMMFSDGEFEKTADK